MDAFLHRLAVVLSIALMLGFALFAIDEAGGASSASQAAIADSSVVALPVTPRQEAARERLHSRPREAVDDVDDVLLAPFAWAAPVGSGAWVRRGLPTLLGLALYGLGLPFLARWARGRA